MGAAGIAAMTMSRPSSRWYALLLAAAVTLALNPRSWLDPGWQLSFAAVTGILTMGVPLSGVLARTADALVAPASAAARALTRGLAEGAAITVAATVATAPLLAHHFGSVSLAALPANLLALPAVAPAMWLGMVKAALGLVAPAVPGADWLAGAVGPAASVPIGYLGWLAARFADMPSRPGWGVLGVSVRATGMAYALIAAVDAGRATRLPAGTPTAANSSPGAGAGSRPGGARRSAPSWLPSCSWRAYGCSSRPPRRTC